MPYPAGWWRTTCGPTGKPEEYPPVRPRDQSVVADASRRLGCMHTWAPVDVPSVPGGGPPLRLHDTSTDEVRATAPGPEALLYVCGITPYDATHLGHAAT